MPRTKNMKLKSIALLGTLALVATLTTACGANQENDSKSAKNFDCATKRLNVVVTVEQWASLATDIGGACVNVTTILSGLNVEPHDYEATPNDATYIKGADLVVANGAGYDEWASDMIDDESRIITAASAASQLAQEPSLEFGNYYTVAPEQNPHLWFSLAVIDKFAKNLSEVLMGDFTDEESQYVLKDNLIQFQLKFKDLKKKVDADREENVSSEKTFASTESVADYLFRSLGYQNLTPEGYMNATEDEAEPSPNDIKDFLDLISNQEISLLAVNIQEMTPVVENLQTAATTDGVPVVETSEMKPNDVPDLIAWLSKIVDLTAGREVLEPNPGNSADSEGVDPNLVNPSAYKLTDEEKAKIAFLNDGSSAQ